MQKDKARDIGRGVLPSRAAKGAKDNKRNFHSKRRSNQRQACDAILRSLTEVDDDGYLFTDPDLFDDFEEPVIHDGYHAGTKGKASSYDDDMGYIVRRRQDADNLGALFSWARATEAKKMVGWTREDKRNYFKAVLPDTLQGRHALGHVEQILDLEPNEFEYGFFRYTGSYLSKTTKDEFRAALDRCLKTTKSRRRLRDAIYDIVPVAAHSEYSNNGDWKWEQARDENGSLLYHEGEFIPADPRRAIPQVDLRRPVMVEVWEPQVVTVSCDDCTFLRNDPLATTEAINRFADFVWTRRTKYIHSAWERRNKIPDHTFVREIYDYIMSAP